MFGINNMFCNIWIDGRGKTSKRIAQHKNWATWLNVFNMLVNEALSRYEIEGLPESCNSRVILQSLLFYASVGFYVRKGNIISLPGLPTTAFTLYGDPTEMIVHGRNGYVETIKLFIPNGDDSALVRQMTGGGVVPEDGTGVWVRENRMVYPFINYCMDYADKIADTMRTLDTTRANIKRPYVVVAEETIINTVKAFFNKRDNNEEYIISSGVFPADKIKLLPFESNPENLRDCTMLIEWYLNQFRQIEGMRAPSTVDKKAQVSVPELNRDAEVTSNRSGSIVDYLQEQLDFANEKLGTNMTVKWKGDEEQDVLGSKRDEDDEGMVRPES